jgi:hypothetical protein
MDWVQVKLNGGPPCFFLEDDGTLCGRAQWWAGHPEIHHYVSLHDYTTTRDAEIAALESRLAGISYLAEIVGVTILPDWWVNTRAEKAEDEIARWKEASGLKSPDDLEKVLDDRLDKMGINLLTDALETIPIERIEADEKAEQEITALKARIELLERALLLAVRLLNDDLENHRARCFLFQRFWYLAAC